jgi:hypothetical protein
VHLDQNLNVVFALSYSSSLAPFQFIFSMILPLKTSVFGLILNGMNGALRLKIKLQTWRNVMSFRHLSHA